MGQPTSLDPNIDRVLNTFIPNVVAQSNAIKLSFFNNFAGNPVGPISKQNIVKFYDAVWCPNRASWEGGWVDDPDDSGGPTMVGVTLTSLRTSFDTLFGSIPGAQAVNATGWKTDRTIGCQVLYRMLSEKDIQYLFMYKFYTNKDGGQANLIATVDPWFSLIVVGSYWGSGGGFYDKGFSAIAKDYGYTGGRVGFGPFVSAFTDAQKIVEFSTKCFTSRVQFMLDISKPGTKNAKFRTGWMRGMVFGDSTRDSKLQLLVRTMDYFQELAAANQLSQQEVNHLTLLKAYYEKVVFIIPE
jgi:hypothetical protein